MASVPAAISSSVTWCVISMSVSFCTAALFPFFSAATISLAIFSLCTLISLARCAIKALWPNFIAVWSEPRRSPNLVMMSKTPAIVALRSTISARPSLFISIPPCSIAPSASAAWSCAWACARSPRISPNESTSVLLNLVCIFSTAVARASTSSRRITASSDGAPSGRCTTPIIFFMMVSGSVSLGLPAPFIRSFNSAASLPSGVRLSSVLRI